MPKLPALVPYKLVYNEWYYDDEDYRNEDVDAGISIPVLSDFAKPHLDVSIEEFSPSLTRQEFAEECDINTIMAKYEKTGVISHINTQPPAYMNLADAPTDLMVAMNYMIEAEAAFMTLPAIVRREFDNDARKFVDYAQDPENLEKMREWGLAPPAPVADAPQRVEIVNPPIAANDDPKPS